jgi:menaquinol-cytochrome c reductase cytochrome b subunit
MAVKSKRQQIIDLAVLAPLDWVDERTAFVRGTKWFLFRNVPRDISWGQTLGSAALTAFIVQALTGAILALYYKPSAAIDPTTGKPVAYSSIEMITDDLTLGWLVRGMHRWGASVFIILLFLHMGRVFLFGAYKYPRELNWLVGVLILTLALFEGLTGYLLPWDQTAYWATVVAININANAPIVGPFLGDFLRGGTEIGENTLSIFYSFHMLVIPGGLIGLILLHLYLVVRLGVTPPPWSDVAGGYEEEDGRPARVGLVEPRPRGNGAMGQPPREKVGA